ncbi:MAG TPA: sulfurtransferase [Gammaproteobacteria bacterium]|nr:sulfurtransferase [Gammaproteobacteria bacterium]
MQTLPLILEPEVLEGHLGEENLLIVDLCKPDTYAQLHVPGAVHLDYGRIVHSEGPAKGLLPDDAELSRVFSEVGLTPDKHVVAYDDEGGGRAARLLWTLEAVGHRNYSLLNGGLHAWANEGHPLSREPVQPTSSDYQAHRVDSAIADLDYVRAHLDDPSVVILDTRSPEEYNGQKVLAARGGHIPRAVNMEWTAAMDQERNLRLKPAETLQAMLEPLGVTPDKTVVTHCQTHHRSAHTFIVLKSLGYTRLKGYPGSWSEWGNRTDTPVE